jgi:hypothetical protein
VIFRQGEKNKVIPACHIDRPRLTAQELGERYFKDSTWDVKTIRYRSFEAVILEILNIEKGSKQTDITFCFTLTGVPLSLHTAREQTGGS